MRTTVLLLVFVPWLACADDKPAQKPLVALSGAKSGIEAAEVHRILTQREFASVWQRHVGAKVEEDEYYNRAGVPEVDFERCMVVGIFQGKGWNSAGVVAVEILEAADRLTFRFDDRSYQTAGPDGGGERVTAFGIFVVPRSTKALVLEEDVQGMIGRPPEWKERKRFDALR